MFNYSFLCVVRYDGDRKGFLTHQEFLAQLGVQFAPGDEAGTSKAIVDNSIRTLDDHHANLMIKHELQTYNQAATVWDMPVETIFIQLR